MYLLRKSALDDWNHFNIKKMSSGALLRAKEGYMRSLWVLIINVISLTTLTEEVLDQLFPEKLRVPFFEVLLSNVMLLYFARTIYVFVFPSGGLTLTGGQPPTQLLAHSSPLCIKGTRRENR